MSKVSEIAATAKESLLQSFLLIIFFPDLKNKEENSQEEFPNS
jgi:hypothetical protein